MRVCRSEFNGLAAGHNNNYAGWEHVVDHKRIETLMAFNLFKELFSAPSD